jgi:hypothetical protein
METTEKQDIEKVKQDIEDYFTNNSNFNFNMILSNTLENESQAKKMFLQTYEFDEYNFNCISKRDLVLKDHLPMQIENVHRFSYQAKFEYSYTRTSERLFKSKSLIIHGTIKVKINESGNPNWFEIMDITKLEPTEKFIFKKNI